MRPRFGTVIPPKAGIIETIMDEQILAPPHPRHQLSHCEARRDEAIHLNQPET